MRLKVTLRRGDTPVDLVVTADATATVGEVADTLWAADPLVGGADAGQHLSLRVSDPFVGAAARTLEAETTLADSALLSGSTLELIAAGGRAAASTPASPVAVLRVLGGPDAGKEFSLPAGASTIGRDRDTDVRLTDPMVSKHHARLNVADVIEVIDLASANGVIVSGDSVGRAVVAPSDVVTLGDTTLCVIRLQHDAGAAAAPAVEHVRSPRLVPAYPGGEFPAPTPPKPQPPHRLPYLALIAPLIMGVAIWAFTQQLLGVIMIALSPLLLLAGYLDQGITARRERKAQRKQFDESMLQMQDTLEKARDEERRVRLQELPTAGELRDDVRRLGPLVWSERPESPRFLCVNAGIGTAPSRNRLMLPGSQDAIPECWQQLTALRDEYARVDGVPIVVNLREAGSFGVAGDAGPCAHAARSILFQITARHSPAEVVLAAFVSPHTRAEWDWVKWMPHAGSVHSPLSGSHLADGRGAAAALLAQLEGLIAARVKEAPSLRGPIPADKREQESRPPVVPSVVVLIEHDAPADRARLTRIVEQGPDVGVHTVWCAPRVEELPAACRSYLLVSAQTPDGIVGQVRHGEKTAPVVTDLLDAAEAAQLGRILAPVIDVGVPESDDSDLPRAVSYPSLAGIELLAEADAVVDRWKQNHSLTPRDGSPAVARKREGTLRAVIGHTGAEAFTLDLRADGPHALVGGTTGAGKSEFLQSWVLGMAAAHSPDRLTFLFVDYKGGSAFADCVDLPHTVGLVTDLSPHLVRRALTSLRAELRYREHLLQQKRAKDLVTLEKRGDPDCPPSLVIVVDEFAALVQEVPEFVDGVVDVAQRGRSLGLHLILATQRPSGVIKDNLRANTNLRIALRMADTDDSVDILGDARAAHFDPSIPGRGAAKTGPGRIRAFQTGYVGGRTTGEPPKPRIDINELDFGTDAEWEQPEPEVAEQPETGPTDITRIVRTIRAAAGAAGVPEPRKPWLSELAPIYSLARLPNPRTDERLLLGVLDNPETQSQPPVFYEPDKDGNLAVYGTGGSGKSTVLRTIAIAAAASIRNGGPTHVYALDFGSRGLSMLDGLAHVGAVIAGDDQERVIRLIRMLRDIVDDRADRYAAVRAGSIGEYRRLAGMPDEPRILLLVDGIGVFKDQYEFGPTVLSNWFTAFAQIAADGRPLGVHVIVAGDRPSSVPASIASTVQRRLVLRMANEDEYVHLGIAKDVLDAASPAGRGVIDGDEVQIAVLGESGNIAVQAREIKRLVGSLERSGLAPATPVARMPEVVAVTDLPTQVDGMPVLGVDDITLGPASFTPTGTFIVAGSVRSGRTTALATISEAVKRARPRWQSTLVAPRRSMLAGTWTRRVEDLDNASDALAELRQQLESSTASQLVVLENVGELDDSMINSDLADLVKIAVRNDHFVVGEAESSAWARAYELGKLLRLAKTGLVLVPGDGDVDDLLDASVGPVRRRDFPVGRGFLVRSADAIKVQVAIGEVA